jgi:hypothetical protein
MRVYALAYRDTMGLPMRVFWQLSGTIPRLLDGENKTVLELGVVATHDPKTAAEMVTELHTRSPEPIKLTAHAIVAANSVRDDAGFNELRSM